MATSLKDALTQAGRVPVEKTLPKPVKQNPEWLHEIADDEPRSHVPFELPARTKVKPAKK